MKSTDLYENIIGKIMPYSKCASKWWNLYFNSYLEPCTDDIEGWPPNMTIRVYEKPGRSCIKGLPIVPYIGTSAIDWGMAMSGGYRQMLSTVIGDGITIDDITVYVKNNIHGTNNGNQFICFVHNSIILPDKKVWLCISKNVVYDLLNMIEHTNIPVSSDITKLYRQLMSKALQYKDDAATIERPNKYNHRDCIHKNTCSNFTKGDNSLTADFCIYYNATDCGMYKCTQ